MELHPAPLISSVLPQYPLFLLDLVFIAKKKAYLPDNFWHSTSFPFRYTLVVVVVKLSLILRIPPYMMLLRERYKL